VRGDDDTVSLVDAGTLTSGVSVARAMVGSRMARRQMSKRGSVEAGGRSVYIALFEPRKYLLRQVVLDLAVICHNCQRGHAIHEGREFIVHCVEGWHFGEKKGFGREEMNGRSNDMDELGEIHSSEPSPVARRTKNQHTRERLVQKKIDLRA
jgi:hypothetical protein